MYLGALQTLVTLPSSLVVKMQEASSQWADMLLCAIVMLSTANFSENCVVLQLGTHLRAKRKREEMSVLLRKTKK